MGHPGIVAAIAGGVHFLLLDAQAPDHAQGAVAHVEDAVVSPAENPRILPTAFWRKALRRFLTEGLTPRRQLSIRYDINARQAFLTAR